MNDMLLMFSLECFRFLSFGGQGGASGGGSGNFLFDIVRVRTFDSS